MKKTIGSLTKGQIVWAEIVEEVGPAHFIVTFDGDLMRVSNHSKKRMKIGEKIKLLVISVKPLAFQLAKSSDTGRFDLSV